MGDVLCGHPGATCASCAFRHPRPTGAGGCRGACRFRHPRRRRAQSRNRGNRRFCGLSRARGGRLGRRLQPCGRECRRLATSRHGYGADAGTGILAGSRGFAAASRRSSGRDGNRKTAIPAEPDFRGGFIGTRAGSGSAAARLGEPAGGADEGRSLHASLCRSRPASRGRPARAGMIRVSGLAEGGRRNRQSPAIRIPSSGGS